jgi:ATP-dependent Clp protease, protease subunit
MRRIYLFGDICNERAEKFIAELHDLFEEGQEPITIFINSSGGSVTDALAIYDVLQTAPCEVYTVGLGKVHSAAVTVLLAAPRENRASYPNTEFMSHDISWKSDGPRAFLKDRVDQLERTVVQLLGVYTRDTEINAEQARQMFFTDLADHYFTAEEALAMGFVSRIITRETGLFGTSARPDLRLVEPVSVAQEELISAVQSSQDL